MSKNQEKPTHSPEPASDASELTEAEAEQVSGGAFLAGAVMAQSGAKAMIARTPGGTAMAQESTTTLSCIDTDDGTLWGCPKLTT